MVSITLILCGGAVLPASAATVWDFTVTTDTVSASGSFTTAGNNPTPFTTYTVQATGLTGTVDGEAILGLGDQGAPDQTFQWDGGTGFLVTFNGITFVNADLAWNVYSDASSGYAAASELQFHTFDSSGLGFQHAVLSATLTPETSTGSVAPEPSSVTLGVAGTLVFAALARRRKVIGS